MTRLSQLVQAKIFFGFSANRNYPQIPEADDAMHLMGILGDDSRDLLAYDRISSFREGDSTYIANAFLLVAAIATEVLSMSPRTEAGTIIKIISRAICELCPPEARCYLNSNYAKAAQAAGLSTPPDNIQALEEFANQHCTCPRHHTKQAHGRGSNGGRSLPM